MTSLLSSSEPSYLMDEWYTLEQQKIMALIPKFSAALSLPSSIFLIYEALGDHRRGKGSPIHRSLIGMSCLDCLSSFGYLMSNWFVPEGFVWGSIGNMNTCQFQGFAVLVACGPPMFNTAIVVFCLLMIKYRWTDSRISKVEPYLYTFIVLWSIGLPFMLIFLNLYNPVGVICWPAEEWGCYGGINVETGDPCRYEHQQYAWIYVVVIFYIPIYSSFIIITICLSMIYWEVRQVHRRLMRYSFSSQYYVSTNTRASDDNNMIGITNTTTTTTTTMESAFPKEGEEERSSPPPPPPQQQQHCQINNSTIISHQRRRASDFSRRQSVNNNSTNNNNVLLLHSQGRSGNDVKRIGTKALLYSFAFFAIFIPSTVWSFYGYVGVTPFGLVVAALLCEPLQGFFNLLIFVRDRPSTQRRLLHLLTLGGYCKATICCFSFFSKNEGDNNSNNDKNNMSASKRTGSSVRSITQQQQQKLQTTTAQKEEGSSPQSANQQQLELQGGGGGGGNFLDDMDNSAGEWGGEDVDEKESLAAIGIRDNDQGRGVVSAGCLVDAECPTNPP